MARTRTPFRLIPSLVALAASLHGCGAQSAPAPATTAAQESITNNQEAGVDEGGIVKAWGDYLVVLRRGRLFTVRVGDRDLSPVCMVDAFPVGSDLGTWYDEMLVSDRTVVVVGYSYRVSATEIGLFELDGQGCVHHRATHFLHSHDYYSSRNYASRLVEGKLVFYMPHYLGSYRIEEGHLVANGTLPSVRRYGDDEWQPVITMNAIHVPQAPHGDTTLHTVVICDLAQGTFDCDARGIVGGFGRTFYVSPNAVYVWVHDGASRPASDDAPATVYRLPLNGTSPSAVRAWGVPTDQFSFSEDSEGVLNVLVRDAGYGDWMGGPEHSAGGVALARIAPSAFSAVELPALAQDAYTPLPGPEDQRPLQNRFVGDYVLYGTGTTWGSAAEGTRAKLFAHPVRRQGDTARLALPHGVDRIEAMGEDAVVIGSDGSSLHFSSLSLDRRPRLVDRFVRPDASQGELRSHGFFYKPEGDREGVLGLPIRRNGAGWFHLRQGSAEILYLEVQDLRFGRLGSLASQDDDVDDDCQVSCVDWYGNARPIFYRGRVFALLGYELVEGVIRRGRVVEVARTHLFRDQQG